MADIRDIYPNSVMAEPNSGCWLWTGAYDGGFGYGKIYRNKRGIYAHRRSYEVSSGKAVPRPLRVLHRCDTPACVNPAHLFLGTQADNVADCAAKGRRIDQRYPSLMLGSSHPRSKITEVQARQVIADRRAGVKLKTIAETRHVPYAIVCHISAGKTWGHVRDRGGEP
jgi:hypothetical protein